MKSLFYLLSLACLFISGLTAEKPNVLFLSVDDLKPELGCYGSTVAVTPNIDRLSGKGVLFNHHYVQQAVCSASRASMFTGLRPDSTRVWDLVATARESNPDAFTMQQYFKDAGYQTAGSGKVMHGFTNDDPLSWSIPFVRPDDLPYAYNKSPALYQQYQGEAIHEAYKALLDSGIKGYGQHQKFMAARNAKPATECLNVPDDAYSDGAMTTWGVEILETLSKSKKPFFLTLGYRKPHLPFVAPKKYWDLFDRNSFELASFQERAKGSPAYAYQPGYEMGGYSDIDLQALPKDLEKQRELIHGYHASVAYIDAQIGRIMEKLDQTGLAKNTIIVLWGDHGWHLGDHNIWCKHTNFEQATRSPLIIVAPEINHTGHTDAMVESIDIFPTLCELAGLEVPAQLQGASLVPVLENTNAHVKLFSMSQYPDWGKKTLMGYSMRSPRFRMVAWMDRSVSEGATFDEGLVETIELYDYELDPLETESKASNPEYQAVKTSMMAALKVFLSQGRLAND
ncbi:MAG TPA: sulfatase [Opitutae bacterium]|nr:sulfatase [Opitutae bacterium]